MILIAAFHFASIAALLKRNSRKIEQEKAFADISFIGLSRVVQSPSLLRCILPFLLVSILVQMSIGAVLLKQYPSSAVLLGIAAAMVAWRLNVGDIQRLVEDQEQIRRTKSSRDFVTAVLIALLTCIVLLPALQSSMNFSGVSSFFYHSVWANTRSSTVKKKDKNGFFADQSYAGIILLTPPKSHTQITPPSPRDPWLTGGRPTKPLVISFDGVYWYFRPPYSRPRRDAHVVRGDPTIAEIRSVNRLPLFMEAHQNLGSHIDLSCCSKVRIALQNADNHPGAIGVELLLRDTSLPASMPQSLGTVTIPSSRFQTISMTRRPVEEMLSFSIPSQLSIHRFDEITVIVHPSYERTLIGAKISIENFVLVP